MATRTAIDHPQKAAQTGDAYPYTLKVIALPPGSGTPTVVLESKCAYEAATGGSPQDFETETVANDRILLPTWEVECKIKRTVILSTPDGFAKRFEIADVIPQGSGPYQTLLIVTRERRP